MWNLLSLNINGLNDRIKRTALVDWLKCMKVDVACLQETHAPSHESIRKWFANSGFRVVSSSVSNKRCGSAILIKDSLNVKQVIRDDAGRFVQALVDFGEDQLSFISLYAPNKNPDRNAFFSSLTGLIDLTRPTFVCGDFNSVLDSDLDRLRRASYTGAASSRTQDSGPALHSLLSYTETYPLWRTLHPSQTAYSWTHASGTFASRIDMVWAPSCLEQSIRECEYHPSFLSDHQYLLVKFVLDDRISTGPGVWKFNTSLLEDPSYCALVSSFWAFWQSHYTPEAFSSILEWWDQGKFYLREVTRSFSRSKEIGRRQHKSLLHKQMHELQHLFELGDPSAFAKLCEVQEELRGIALHEAKGAQVRARCQWAEEGETSSSFFLNLATKRHAKQVMRSIRDPDTGSVHHDPFEILGVWQRYYSGLFTAASCDLSAQDDILSKLSRRLSDLERASCEGLLSLEECFAALSGMARGKTPGSDGFPMEFYLRFWQSLGADLVRVLNVAFETGQLSTSQRRGLIIVLFKKNDRLETKNWRPISLLNVDYKIATRAISGRLLAVIGSIVGPDQTCGVPGRTISENLFLIRDLIDYAEQEDIPLALLSLDQEKAFDRVDWGFLYRILDTFNFGPAFCRWIKLFYTNVESAVVINGWSSSFFSPSRGVRQGCPLSPLLYVLSIEVLAANIRSAPGITGVFLPHSLEQFKCSGYADDTTIAATSDESIEETFAVYSQFERASGARLNRGKSKGMWLGSWKQRSDAPFGLQWVKQLPLLGATFSAGDYSEPTWEPATAKLEKRLSDWSGRKLSFQGKATIINSLALSQLWHLCHVFPVPKWAAKRINKAVWSFFWSGKRDLVARKAVCLPKSKGGFGVIDFQLKADAFALQWVKRFFASDRGKWKNFFTFFVSASLQSEPREALLSRVTRRQMSTMPEYYQVIFRVWQSLDGGLHDDELCLAASSASPLAVERMSSRNVYKLSQDHLNVQPHCLGKFAPQYGPLHWPQTWSQLHLCPFDRIVTDLNWQIAHGVLYTGARLGIRFNITTVDPRCFCRADDETLEHLFFECELARLLVAWVHFNLWQISPSAAVFSVTELLFGFSPERRRIVPPIIIWMLQVMKHTIWVARCDFRFRGQVPVASECQKKAIAKIKFVLRLFGRRCRLPAQVRSFERDWLARGILGHFEEEELVFSF